MILIKKQLDIPESILQKINNEIYKLSKFEYGWYDFKNNKKILPNTKEWDTPSYFEKNCRVLSPDEVLKYKLGTCWDFSVYMASYLKNKLGVDSFIYFLANKSFTITHTFLVFKYLMDFYICEPTILSIMGIYKINKKFINSDEEIEEYILNFYRKKYKKTNFKLFGSSNSLPIINVANKKELTAHKFISFFKK